MNPLFRIDFSISDSLKIVRKSVLIYETIIFPPFPLHQKHLYYTSYVEKYQNKRHPFGCLKHDFNSLYCRIFFLLQKLLQQ